MNTPLTPRKRLLRPLLLAALLTGIAGTAVAGAGKDGRRPHDRPASLEMLAVQNQMLSELSTQTGRSTTEIAALFDEEGPRGAAETLGLDRDAMRQTMISARETVIAKAQTAGLITAEQAQTLKDTPPPLRRSRRDAPPEAN